MVQTDQYRYWYKSWQRLKVLRNMYLALQACVRTPQSRLLSIFFNAKQVPDRDVGLCLVDLGLMGELIRYA